MSESPSFLQISHRASIPNKSATTALDNEITAAAAHAHPVDKVLCTPESKRTDDLCSFIGLAPLPLKLRKDDKQKAAPRVGDASSF